MSNKLTKETFLEDVANHKLTVVNDNGLYRHLVLSKGSFDQRFEITTWPNYLCISGDMGCYVFSRVEDMFTFFRNNQEDWGINTGYWHEKVEAECGRDGVTKFDIQQVFDRLDQYLSWFIEGKDTTDEEDAKAIEAATEQVNEFKECCEHSEYDAMNRYINWDSAEAGGMDLDDFWDGGFTKYTTRYLWCCYAIVWAIRQYDDYVSCQEAA